MDGPTLDFIFRILGRLGFLASLYGAYKLGKLPVLKSSATQFFWIAGILSVLSLLLTVGDFLFSGLLINVLSLIFNVTSTWILAAFFFIKTYNIRRSNPVERIRKFQDEINEKIQNLKS